MGTTYLHRQSLEEPLMHKQYRFCLLSILLLVVCATPSRAESLKNHFASITVGGKKVGQVHFMVRHDDDGVLQELKTRASLSIFGIEVYHHSLHTHELWQQDELKLLWGVTNENGKDYQLDLKRAATGYAGVLNQQPVELPEDSFPTAVWHYAITEHSILFAIPELQLKEVQINKSADSVRIGKQDIEAERFEFSGDWNATVWFDLDKQFLKWEYKVKGRTIVVLLDAWAGQ